MYWKPNQTDDPPTALWTNAYIFEPDTNKTGYRFSTITVTFLADCKDTMVWNQNHSEQGDRPLFFLMYPYSYATVSPNFSAEFQDLPSFCEQVSLRDFTGSSDTYTKNFSAGELFIGYRGTVHIKKTTDERIVLVQSEIDSCTIVVEAFGPVVLVSSLRLFYGVLALILIPAFITIVAHFVILTCQRNAAEKSEAGFKRVTHECRLFWITWVGAFALFIGFVLVPIY